MKCGTSAVNTYLRYHPKAIPTGELYFFLKAYQNIDPEKGVDELYREYRSLMPSNAKGRMIYEKTPTYYRIPRVPARILDIDPNMKLIFIGESYYESSYESYHIQYVTMPSEPCLVFIIWRI